MVISNKNFICYFGKKPTELTSFNALKKEKSALYPLSTRSTLFSILLRALSEKPAR